MTLVSELQCESIRLRLTSSARSAGDLSHLHGSRVRLTTHSTRAMTCSEGMDVRSSRCGHDDVITLLVWLMSVVEVLCCSWWTRSWSSCHHSPVTFRRQPVNETRSLSISCCVQRSVTLPTCVLPVTATSTPIDSAGQRLTLLHKPFCFLPPL